MAFVNAMREVDMSDAPPRSPIYLDEYNNAVQNVYVRQITLDEDGNLYNKALYTVKEVSQFGPYDPAVYMSFPEDVGNYPVNKRNEMPEELLQVDEDYEFIPFVD